MLKCDFFEKKLDKFKGYAPFILRLVLGIIFVAHGYGKLFGSAPGLEQWIGFAASLGFPAFFAYLVGIIELLGGLFLIVGFLTRYSAFLIGIVMLVAIFKAKLALGLIGGYELDLMLLATAVSLMLTGAGDMSLDKKICGK